MYSNTNTLEYIKDNIDKENKIENDLYNIYKEKFDEENKINKEVFKNFKIKFEKLNKIYEENLEILNSYKENIWLKSIMNIPEMSDLIEPNDEIILSNLIKIEFCPNDKQSELKFYFKENQYFFNNLIKITYHHEENWLNNINKIVSDEIEWKQFMNPFYINSKYIELINIKTKEKIKRLKNYETYSFFIFFCNLDYNEIMKNFNNEKYSITESTYSDKTFNFNKNLIIKDKEELYLSSLKILLNFKNKIIPYIIPLYLNIELSFINYKNKKKNSFEISDNFEDESDDNFDYELENDYSPYKIKKIIYDKNIHNKLQ